jgi:threonine dehydrogenase-like Zn-dependent dehydrogenase
MNSKETAFDFSAPELNRDGSIERQSYRYEQQANGTWQIFRNGKPHLTLKAGYKPYKTISCGICSTDLAKPFLPYPLPQIIGHEVVVAEGQKQFCVEINASHEARNDHASDCPFCSHQLSSHCPERLTLGINLLPGGFSPYLLAPKNALHKVPENIPSSVATLAEPLAAAIQALKASPPQTGDHVAVLGPRRLGSLLLMALANFRKSQQLDFKISALIRHENLQDLCINAGADEIVMTQKLKAPSPLYDIIYDTTGKPEGFEFALQLTRRELHLKSTHGQPIDGAKRWADFVVDELALCSSPNIIQGFQWSTDQQPTKKSKIFISNHFTSKQLEDYQTQFPYFNFFQGSIQDAFAHQLKENFESASQLPRFDGAFITSLSEFDELLRPKPDLDYGCVRPRGWIYLPEPIPTTNLNQALKRGVKIQSSRCGPFHEALELLESHPEFVSLIESKLITHHFHLNDLQEAMTVASNSRESLKVIVHNSTHQI